MKAKTIIALILIACLLSSCSNNSATVKTTENYMISDQHYSKLTELDDWSDRDLDIGYPVVAGLSDTKKQDRINKLLKDEAFRWFNIWPDYEDALKNISLFIEYDILFQREDYLCVNYSGMYTAVSTPHPNHLFETIIIDMSTGSRLRLTDIVNVDYAFVQTVKEYLLRYKDLEVINVAKFSNSLQKHPEYAAIYESALEDYDDEGFLNMLLNADDENGGSCVTYFTKDVFGIRFSVAFQAGNHYEIEIRHEDMEKHMIISDLW